MRLYLDDMFPPYKKERDLKEGISIKAKNTPHKLYKYSPIKIDKDGNSYLFSNLLQDKFSLSKAIYLNDPFECSNIFINKKTIKINKSNSQNSEEFMRLTKEQQDFVKPIYKNDDTVEKRYINYVYRMSENARHITYIGSLSENNTSCAMWAHYANSYKGICIEYDLNEILFTKEWESLQPVVYRNRIPDFSKGRTQSERFNEQNLIYLAMVKGKEWAYEREWRFIYSIVDTDPYLIIKVPTPKAIYLGLRISKKNEERISEIAKEKNIDVYKMKPPIESFEIQYEKMNFK